MKKISAVFVFVFLAASCLFADYANSVALGDMAYENWDLKEALRYYQAAFIENPNAALEVKINDVKAKLGRISSDAKYYEQKKSDNPWKWVLLGTDALGVAGSVYTIMDYNKALKIWHDSFNDDPFYSFGAYTNMWLKGIYMYVTVSVAGGLILYTLADVFWLHIAFPANVETTYIPGKNELKLTYNFAF
jgi:tetratricopeptide (TPR) repeat protein